MEVSPSTMGLWPWNIGGTVILSHQGLYIYIISYGDLSNRWGYHGENGRYIYIYKYHPMRNRASRSEFVEASRTGKDQCACGRKNITNNYDSWFCLNFRYTHYTPFSITNRTTSEVKWTGMNECMWGVPCTPSSPNIIWDLRLTHGTCLQRSGAKRDCSVVHHIA